MSRNAGCDPGHTEAAHHPRNERVDALQRAFSALKAARAAAERQGAAFSAEKARWKEETAQAVAGALARARAEAAEERVLRERHWHAEVAPTTEKAPQTERSGAELAPEQDRRELQDVSQTPAMTNGHDVPAATSGCPVALYVAGSDAGSEAEAVEPDFPVFFRQMVREVQSPASGWRRLLARLTSSTE